MLISFPNITSSRARFGIVGGEEWEAPTEGFDSALDGQCIRVRNHWHVYKPREETSRKLRAVSEGAERVLRFRSVSFVPLFFALKEKWHDELVCDYCVAVVPESR